MSEPIYNYADDPDWDVCDICQNPIDYCQGHGELV